MHYLNGWHPYESIRFDLVKITMWRCLVLQIWEQRKQLLRKQRVIQLAILDSRFFGDRQQYIYIYVCVCVCVCVRACVRACVCVLSLCLLTHRKFAILLNAGTIIVLGSWLRQKILVKSSTPYGLKIAREPTPASVYKHCLDWAGDEALLL